MSIHVHNRATFVQPQTYISMPLPVFLFHVGLDQCDAGNDACNFIGNWFISKMLGIPGWHEKLGI